MIEASETWSNEYHMAVCSNIQIVCSHPTGDDQYYHRKMLYMPGSHEVYIVGRGDRQLMKVQISHLSHF